MSAAAGLLARFDVHGRYYDAELDGRRFALRSHLEIVERGLDPVAARVRPADLVAVMMNPGSSRPLADLDADGWAPALPDRTQYQLMRLALRAQAQGWSLRHIRVINLSDLRTPKSAELFAALATLADDRHSIFSPARAGELARALGPAQVPVLRAWGLARELAPLASKAIAATSSRRVLGLTDQEPFYRHPLPQRADLQRAWLDAMTRQLPVRD
ncbi:hypothetical protein MOJ79_03330 [Calidifontimicrobium sp. SYSU G02091]|uniref:hypothetical protein n=1 Tax=Calidifontimicrobium sp. SYSU G02091 TaxID=2926421 RepID=UPI001F536A5F|nr:hypothetical protein [Calidifontimicrobium sp. SYSU G02091]MCI1190870.1 hypothetical protein [Calidifontimicrobium sp. SYSU G02091]